MVVNPRGRPKKYSEYEKLLKSLPKPMTKRPKYEKGIGIFRGATGDTAWVKIRLPHGAIYNEKSHAPGTSLEIKLGKLSSWSWAQLESKHAELQGRADRDEPLENEPGITFSDWSTDWLARAKSRVRDHLSLRIHVQKHLLPTFGAKLLTSITSSDINRWASQQLADFAPGTVKRQMNTFKAILNDAVKSGRLETNPYSNADPIRGITRRQRFLSHEELARLMIAADEVADWMPDYILWCLHSGMRKGEIQTLEWNDIQQVNDGPIIVNVRTSKADQPRYVYCTGTMNEILERQEDRKVEGDERVFTISAMTLRRRWEAARKLANLEDVTIHDLRRTHSTYAAAAGVDLNTLANRIGHSDLSMLQKHYAAIVGSAAEDAATTIQSVFNNLAGSEND